MPDTTTMNAIFSVPEIVILVFQRCDGFQDAIALASTCKFVASIWRLHFSSIIWPLAKAEIPGFSQALMAARATAIVCDACEANALPPHPFPLNELSGDIRKPDLKDLKQVFELRHLVRCVEQMYLKQDHGFRNEIPRRDRRWSDSDDDPTAMRDRFHTSIYRVLFAGAVLTRPYLEPMFMAPTQGPPDLLYRLHRPDPDNDEAWLSAKDIEYFERFPVYRFEATDDEWEPVFGDLARWLVNDVKNTATRVEIPRIPGNPRLTRTPLWHLTPVDRGCLQEVLFFLAAYEHTIDKFFNEDIKDASDEEMEEQLLIPPPFQGDMRDVLTAMLSKAAPWHLLARLLVLGRDLDRSSPSRFSNLTSAIGVETGSR